MQIEIGRYYVNKTWKYLLPCLRDYGDTFRAKYNSLFKLAAGIHDGLLDGTPFENQRTICILIDKFYKRAVTENIMQWLRYQEYVLTDYAFDDLENGRKHMFILKVPEAHNDTYDEFIAGNYSKMYDGEQVERFFKDKQDIKDVLLKTNNAYSNFITKVNNNFGTNVTKYDLIGAELDFPLEKYKEVFNYRKQE